MWYLVIIRKVMNLHIKINITLHPMWYINCLLGTATLLPGYIGTYLNINVKSNCYFSGDVEQYWAHYYGGSQGVV